jgi:hypothetical protein
MSSAIEVSVKTSKVLSSPWKPSASAGLKELHDLANPCMKCGSVQCAICYKDLKKWIKKNKINEALLALEKVESKSNIKEDALKKAMK